MKTSTKVLLIINVIALVGAGVFFTALLSIVNISGGVAFTFNRQSIIALTFFLLWVITGFVLFIRFVKKLSFPRKLFFSTISSTAVFAFLVVVLYNINSISYAPVVNFRQVSGIGQNYTIVYVLIAVLAVLYIAFLAISFRVLSKPIMKKLCQNNLLSISANEVFLNWNLVVVSQKK